MWSLNPAWSQPYRFGDMMKQKERGCKFVVVDPRITPTVTGLADVHLQLRPGTDGALALGFIHVMLRDGLYDKDFVEKWTHGFDELSGYVQEFTPERVEAVSYTHLYAEYPDDNTVGFLLFKTEGDQPHHIHEFLFSEMKKRNDTIEYKASTPLESLVRDADVYKRQPVDDAGGEGAVLRACGGRPPTGPLDQAIRNPPPPLMRMARSVDNGTGNQRGMQGEHHGTA